ncbi:hypothetical protein L1987_19068 [Smallanthus sonchifolius]|uniref:Uncharacterized protein n=1 Tax=Smallanthus sonchifolius TaxID=185202 RepID=A0ACB9J4Y4_9ASTR|nr:hypothetical protein L1987_19068 [Smallanthus sonchifolius]
MAGGLWMVRSIEEEEYDIYEIYKMVDCVHNAMFYVDDDTGSLPATENKDAELGSEEDSEEDDTGPLPATENKGAELGSKEDSEEDDPDYILDEDNHLVDVEVDMEQFHACVDSVFTRVVLDGVDAMAQELQGVAETSGERAAGVVAVTSAQEGDDGGYGGARGGR